MESGIKKFGVIFFLLFALECSAQKMHPPIINVRHATAEFICDDYNPWFVVKGVRVSGKYDTLKAVVQTSTIRSVGQDYNRFKAVVDSIVDIGEVPDSLIMAITGSSTHELAIFMHLDGKGLPLPADSVRGAARLTVSAAFWNGTDWVGTTSEVFQAHVMNVPIAKPRVRMPADKNVKIVNAADPTFSVKGLVVSVPEAAIVDGVRDTRDCQLDAVEVVVSSVKLKDGLNQRFSVNAVYSLTEQGVPELLCRIIAPILPFQQGTLSGTVTFSIKSRLLYRGVPGPHRTVPLTINING
ncbi:MAG: hypothetical protein HQ472_06795 [Ignavibacteria bacterium]|nr:hypothetical protein [Ignavibacteria bacterium]